MENTEVSKEMLKFSRSHQYKVAKYAIDRTYDKLQREIMGFPPGWNNKSPVSNVPSTIVHKAIIGIGGSRRPI